MTRQMSAKSQVAFAKDWLVRQGIPPETVDVTSYIDRSLSYEENIKLLGQEFGIGKRGMDAPKVARGMTAAECDVAIGNFDAGFNGMSARDACVCGHPDACDERERQKAAKARKTTKKPAAAKPKKTAAGNTPKSRGGRGMVCEYRYAMYNRPVWGGLSLSQPYTIDFELTHPGIVENRRHYNRDAHSILITNHPLTADEIRNLELVDIAADNKQRTHKAQLIEYIGTLDEVSDSGKRALVGMVEFGKYTKNKADVDKYAAKFMSQGTRKPAAKPAAKPKTQPVARKPAPNLPPALTAPPELAADVLGTGPMGLPPTAAPKRKPAARTTKPKAKKTPAAKTRKPTKKPAKPKAKKPAKKAAAAKPAKKAAKPKAKPADDDKPKTYSGHGNIKQRKLTANQTKILQEKEVVEVVVEGYLKQVRSQNVRGGHYEYYRRSEKEKPAPALRNYDRDEALPASHRPSKKRGRMFEGDIGRFI